MVGAIAPYLLLSFELNCYQLGGGASAWRSGSLRNCLSALRTASSLLISISPRDWGVIMSRRWVRGTPSSRPRPRRTALTLVTRNVHVIEPSTVYLENWHIDLIAEYLEAVTAGQIKRLLINMPPRYAKSTCVSIMWSTWVWAREPFPGKPHNPALEGPGTRWIGASDLAPPKRNRRRSVLAAEDAPVQSSEI